MIKLLSLLKEARQRGNLYHFTPMSNIARMIQTGYIKPNQENQVSTTRSANTDPYIFTGDTNQNFTRLMFDGDKISENYKVVPFAFGGNLNKPRYDTQHGYGSKEGQFEEQIIVNGKNFSFLPYLKRVDLFIVNPKDREISKTTKLLDKANIKYKIYNESPTSGISYKQSKEGNPKDIAIDKIPKIKEYTPEELLYPSAPNAKTEWITLYTSKDINRKMDFPAVELPEYPGYYVMSVYQTNKDIHDEYSFDRDKKPLGIKYIDIPMYNDPAWRKKWKYTKNKGFSEEEVPNMYGLVPKNKVVKAY
jgi:hypothetical protein